MEKLSHSVIEPFDSLFKWENIKYFALISNDKQVQADVEIFLDKKKSIFNEQLKFYPNRREKLSYINKQISELLDWLQIRKGSIYLLDGRLDDLVSLVSNTIEVRGFESNKSLLEEFRNIKKLFDTFPHFQITFTIDQANNSVEAYVKILGNLDIYKFFLAFVSLQKIRKLQDSVSPKIEFPIEYRSMSWNFIKAFFFKKQSILTYELPKIIYKPFVITHVHRLYLNFLIEKQSEFMNNQLESYPNWLKPTAAPLINETIQIQLNYVFYVTEKLRQYFSDEDSLILEMLLKGTKQEDAKITFLDSGSKLGYFFYQLHDKGIITGEKKNTEVFLIKYFQFKNQKTKDYTPFTKGMAHMYISSKHKLKHKKLIDLSDFEQYKENNIDINKK